MERGEAALIRAILREVATVPSTATSDKTVQATWHALETFVGVEGGIWRADVGSVGGKNAGTRSMNYRPARASLLTDIDAILEGASPNDPSETVERHISAVERHLRSASGG